MNNFVPNFTSDSAEQDASIHYTSQGLVDGNPFHAGSRVPLRGAKRVEPPIQGASWTYLPTASCASRINVEELKNRLSKIIGPEKEKVYFHLFSRFLSHRLSKLELENKLSLTIGKENISLHNQIVRAIFSNAINAKSPPSVPLDDITKTVSVSRSVKGIRKRFPSPSVSNCYQSASQSGSNSARSYGTQVNGRTDNCKQVMSNEDISISWTDEAEQCDLTPSSKRVKVDTDSSLNRDNVDLPPESQSLKDTEGDEVALYLVNKSSISAPLGLPSFARNIGGACHFIPRHGHLKYPSCIVQGLSENTLPHTESLKSRMERIAAIASGPESVSLDCANLLNHALDLHLKRLITSCVEVVKRNRHRGSQGQKNSRTFSPSDHVENSNKLQCDSNSSNTPSESPQIHDKIGTHVPYSYVEKQYSENALSFTDFRIAMELNPQQLGENWPTHLERILLHSFER